MKPRLLFLFTALYYRLTPTHSKHKMTRSKNFHTVQKLDYKTQDREKTIRSDLLRRGWRSTCPAPWGFFWYLAFRSLLKFFCFHGSLETRNYYFYPRGSESLYTIRNSKMETDKFLSSIFTRCTAQHKKEHFLCAAIVILHWQLRSQEILHSDKCRKTNQVESAHTYNCLNVNV